MRDRETTINRESEGERGGRVDLAGLKARGLGL